MTLEILNQFEDIIKKYQAAFFNKLWERAQTSYKLIYNIQGLIVDNKFYPNLKFIFWLNQEKTELTENLVSYLYSQSCDYKSETITETNLEEVIQRILKFILDEDSNHQLSNLIVSGTEIFNQEIKKLDTKDFVQTLRFMSWKQAGDDKSCIDTVFNFELETNNKVYKFSLKCHKENWSLIYNSESNTIQFKELPKKLLELIYAVNGNNI